MNPGDGIIPRIPVGEWVESGLDWLTDNLGGLFDVISMIISSVVDGVTDVLLAVPVLPMIVLLALVAWLVRSWKLAIGVIITFALVQAMDQWEPMIQTMAMVIIATAIAVLIAVPLGILAAKNGTVSAIVKPILDFMQTMPAFVYLIPAVILFSVGVVPGMFATVIFALPPGVRMTELGIRGVDSETVEAGESFGATPGQILGGIQIPLAIPTIMAGINQVIMLSLSMSVIAGFVGADGLGKVVVSGVTTLNIAQGVEGGLAVVILAVFLDRITAALGSPKDHPSSIIAMIRRSSGTSRRSTTATATAPTATAATATAPTAVAAHSE